MRRVSVVGLSGSGKTTTTRAARNPNVRLVRLRSPDEIDRWLEAVPPKAK